MRRVTDINEVLPVLAGWDETFVKTCLEGRIGSIWAADGEVCETVLLTVGEFVLFAGTPSEDAVRFVPYGYKTNFAIMFSKGDDDRWGRLIEKVYGNKAKKTTRYAIKKEGVSSFSKIKLAAIAANIAEGYGIVKIDRELYEHCRSDEFFSDLVSQYPTYGEYERHGLGFMALHDGSPAAGCSSFSDYPGGVEIEICTRPEHRRRGLASVLAARFILECIERGLYPSWDAANLSSLALAEKLGYRLDREYVCYEITDYNK